MFPVAVLWLIAGVVMVATEVVSGHFVLLMLGTAALGTAAASALGVPPGLDAGVFAFLSVALLVLARPALLRRMRATPPARTNVQALIGSRAIVESTVDAHGGRVRIGGELWSARAFDETQVIEAGQTVTVMEISGATAVVWVEP